MAFGGSVDFEGTLLTQGEVSAPGRSAWVSANAGSGKTHVLIQRVTRLLLARTSPSKIVCITYTKAAAAEMAERLFGQLGQWALMPDTELKTALAKVVGAEEAAEAELGEARKLFARALETPGGLKIQTIHSFCEMVLRRFPAEAALLPGFKVMEEADAAAALWRIVERLAEEALAKDEALLAAFDRLGAEYSPGQPGGFQLTLQGLLMAFAGKRGRILEAHRRAGGLEAFCADLRARCGLLPSDDEDAVEARAAGAADRFFLREVAQQFAGGGATAQKISAQAAAFLETGRFCDLESLALTKDKKPRSTGQFGNKSKALVADFEERWTALCSVALEGIALREAVGFCRVNEALHRLGAEVCRRFEIYKTHTGLLDFEDLIERTVRLMAETSNAWVLYKLDQGVEHVLLDEAQDTGALQWEVIERLTEEFFAGEGTAERARTLFVVGDEKQSIYSFQGADADLFHQKREALKERAREGLVDRSLGLSFRSTAPVLDFVDMAMTTADGRPLLGEDYQLHSTKHEGLHGRVELWPLIEKGESGKVVPWELPVDTPGEADPRRRLAASIAREIDGWVKGGEVLANPKRPVSYGDVLILCQTRGPQFQEIVRALAAGGIPCAGADKVRMKDDVAVRDLLALLRFAANEDDCLSLAELLKSPFWDLCEDELFALAHGRKGRLWAAVLAEAERKGALGDKCRLVRDEIGAAVLAGRRRGPFALLSAILEGGGKSGRRRIAERLGSVSDEAIGELLSEALSFELEHPRTIEGFLSHLEGFSGEVKKEQAGAGNAVRVMTVHGAKGLQAPIVILADAGDLKEAHSIFRQNPLIELGQENAAGAFVPEAGCLACVESGMSKGPPAARAAKAYADGRRMEEYRRLFYVAATRAAGRVYICGTAEGKRKPDAPAETPPHY
jgi:ATP-dependent helicase/nuclease subunit A